MRFKEIFRLRGHKIQEPDKPEGGELPELITWPERSRRMRAIAHDYFEGKISYTTLAVLRHELYDPRRVMTIGPDDNRVATRSPTEK